MKTKYALSTLLFYCALIGSFAVGSPAVGFYCGLAQEEQPESPADSQDVNQDDGAQAESDSTTESDSTETSAKTDSLDDLRSQWTALDKQMGDKEQAFETTDDAEQKDQIRKEYLELIDQANELIARLKDAGLKSLEGEPGNVETVRLLMGIMMNDAQNALDNEVMQLGHTLIAADVHPKYFETAAESDRLTLSAREMFEELLIRQREAQADDLPRVKLETSKGEIVIELFENEAPNATANFISLAESKFYDGLTFHRVIEDFMAQTGDPEGTGSGGPGYTIDCECHTPEARRHFTGSLSMAHAGKNTGGSQFFLTFERTDSLDGKHTVFGRVVSGQKICELLNRTHQLTGAQEIKIPDVEPDKIIRAEVVRKRDHEYTVKKNGEDDSTESQPDPSSEQPPAQPGGDQQGSAENDDDAGDSDTDDGNRA